jgi:hypothetical protein
VADQVQYGGSANSESGEQAAVWSTVLSELALEVERAAEEGHRRAAEDARLNGRDAIEGLHEHGRLVTEELPPEYADLPVRGGPSDVIPRCRPGQVEDSWYDKEARRQDPEREARNSAARERAADSADMLRYRGEEAPTFAQSVACHAAAVFGTQDQRDRARDPALSRLVEQEHAERVARLQAEARLAKVEGDAV